MKRSKKNEQNLPELANRKSDPLSAKIIRNVISSGVRSFLVAPVPFLLTPIILYKIGQRVTERGRCFWLSAA